jgi:DNA-directed RNA polymerase specialized sigma24 family protein
MRPLASEPTPPEPRDRPSVDEAFRLLHEETIGDVLAWLVRLRVPYGEHADAMQEVYLEAWRSRAGFDRSRGEPRQWINGIAANVAARYRKRLHHKARREEPVLDDFDAMTGNASAEDRMELNDRARFVLRLFDDIQTVPLAILIAHDMNGEPMKDIAARHSISVSEAYRLRDRARHAFTEGYDREQARRREAGAAVMPIAALTLLDGRNVLPKVSAELSARLWSHVERAIAATGDPLDVPRAPRGDRRPADPPSRAASPAPPARGASRARAWRAPALRAGLATHPLATGVLFYIGGVLTAVSAFWIHDAVQRHERAAVAREVPAAADVAADPEPSAAPSSTTAATSARAAAPGAEGRGAAAPGGEITPAEIAAFDVARTAFKSGDTDGTIKAIADYLKDYPRGHFAGDCEKMQIQALIRAGRTAEARDAIDRIRRRSPKSPLLKELESDLPSP